MALAQKSLETPGIAGKFAIHGDVYVNHRILPQAFFAYQFWPSGRNFVSSTFSKTVRSGLNTSFAVLYSVVAGKTCWC